MALIQEGVFSVSIHMAGFDFTGGRIEYVDSKKAVDWSGFGGVHDLKPVYFRLLPAWKAPGGNGRGG